MASPKRQTGDDVVSNPGLVEKTPRDQVAVWGNQQKDTKSPKRFKCQYQGCGKLYSRAEHLERHALNHAPKEIFHCTFPGCKRRFVRQDLCTRHLKRHMCRSSTGLQKRSNATLSVLTQETGKDHGTVPDAARPAVKSIHPEMLMHDSLSPAVSTTTDIGAGQPASSAEFQQLAETNSLASRADIAPHFDGNTPLNRYSKSEDYNHIASQHDAWAPGGIHIEQDHSNIRPQISGSRQGPNSDSSAVNFVSPGDQAYSLGTHVTTAQDAVGQNVIRPDVQQFSIMQSPAYTSIPTNVGISHTARPVNGMIDALNDQSFSESPSSVRNDFTAWFFDSSQNLCDGLNSTGPQPFLGPLNVSGPVGLSTVPNYFTNFFGSNQYPSGLPGRTQFEAFGSGYEHLVDTTLSQERWRYLIEFMRARFVGGNEPAGQFQRDQIFRGNHDSDEDILNLRLMRCYIGSYWHNFHEQFPILHKPTFSADHAPDLLLFAVMAIGASLLSNEYSAVTTAAAHNFANFVAWHVRWQVYMDSNFHPPAKLWVFQTLLLLEVYEKTNATRVLHERSNIHCALTINLMRRSTALNEDLTLTPRPPASPREWWDRWINAEATRRVAYAAFLLDATHAIMFGHPAVMVVQEIRLPLPCDEAQWSATSPTEVGLVESCLHANGIKPTTFLQGLKRILTGRKVRSSAFGRLALMAGLLSISWHMRQRELQMSTLEVPQAMGVPDTWRPTLTEAFDFWKRDFDEDVAHMRMAPNGWQFSAAPFDNVSISDHATVLHHLSHLAMQVDIADCQIAAGARVLTGRAVTDPEHDRVHEKMSKWCKSESAPQAVYHAIQLLHKFATRPPSANDTSVQAYIARNDCLLSRPWALYFAALIVWCYSFFNRRNNAPQSIKTASTTAPVSSFPRNSVLLQPSQEQTARGESAYYDDIHLFLNSAASKTAGELALLDLGERNVTGVLQLLEISFREARWELLHEAADRLREARSISGRKDPNASTISSA